MGIVIQLLINSLIAGAIYALVAAGFSLIYSTNKFVHFAHGSVIAFSAYMLYLFYSILKFNFGIAVILTILFSGVFGYLLNLIYKKLRERNASSVICYFINSKCWVVNINRILNINFIWC